MPLNMFGRFPSVVGPPTFLYALFGESRFSPTSLIQVSYSEPIHTAASAGKWGSGSGGIGMMQSFAWDPSTIPLGSVGSLVPGARQENRSIRLPFSKPSQASFKLEFFTTNDRATQVPSDACLSRSRRLLAAKPPNGTRRGLIPGPVNRLHAPTRCLLRMQTSKASNWECHC